MREAQARADKTSRQRGYTWQWQKARAVFLAEPGNQFCRKCHEHGLLNAGTLRMDGTPERNPRRIGLVVDHVIPHRGDQSLFWDRSNWQTLCHDHHDIVKQREEHGRDQAASILTGGRLVTILGTDYEQYAELTRSAGNSRNR